MMFALALGAVLAQGRDTASGECVCTIERREGLSTSEFLEQYSGKRPVIISGLTDNTNFARAAAPEALRAAHGHREVILSTSNTYSYDKVRMTLSSYLDRVVASPVGANDAANETLYFFGDTRAPWLDAFLEDYTRVPLPGDPALSFGIGAHNSGVPFHFHGPGFSEVLTGRKRWFLYPADTAPEHFEPDRTALWWVKERYSTLQPDSPLLECTIKPGEILYFPDRWYHATLNEGVTVFVSTFLAETR